MANWKTEVNKEAHHQTEGWVLKGNQHMSGGVKGT